VSDPERLLSVTHEGDELERELLGSVRNVSPPAHAKSDAWAGIAAQVALTALVGGSQAAAAAASESAQVTLLAAKTAALKIVLALALGGAVLGAGATWFYSRAAAKRATPISSANQPAAPALRPAPAVVVVAEATAEPAPCSSTSAQSTPCALAPAPASASAVGVPRASAERSPGDQLSAESALLTKARAELRRGDPRGAQVTLSHLQAQFPSGVLGQEREVLSIELLAANGKADAARQRA